MSKNTKLWPKSCIWPQPIDVSIALPWDDDEIPDELDNYTQGLVDIKDYYDDLVAKSILDDDYCLIDDEDFEENNDSFIPDLGKDYWDDNSFDIDLWRDDLSDALNSLKIPAADIKNDPVLIISNIIGYRFVNENLLRQAFTRRAFQIEYHLSGCSEELEFLGDSVLSLYVTKELFRHFTMLTPSDTGAPFCSQYDEGEFSRLKSRFVCKEHLAARCTALNLTPYILYGTGEERSESSREDVVEAIIGAVAIDSNYNWDVLEIVIDRLIDLQVEKVDSYLKRSYYDLFNSWHHKRFGFLPEYIVEKNSQKNSAADNNFYSSIIKFCVPENDKGILTAQNISINGDTRSKTRECLAELAYRFLTSNGLWVNIKDSNIVPDFDKSINQLQEMFQKGYIDKAEYEFNREGVKWSCSCIVNGVVGRSVNSYNKTVAKKFSSYEALILLFKASGCCRDEWFSDYIKAKNSQKDSAARNFYLILT